MSWGTLSGSDGEASARGRHSRPGRAAAAPGPGWERGAGKCGDVAGECGDVAGKCAPGARPPKPCRAGGHDGDRGGAGGTPGRRPSPHSPPGSSITGREQPRQLSPLQMEQQTAQLPPDKPRGSAFPFRGIKGSANPHRPTAEPPTPSGRNPARMRRAPRVFIL